MEKHSRLLFWVTHKRSNDNICHIHTEKKLSWDNSDLRRRYVEDIIISRLVTLFTNHK